MPATHRDGRTVFRHRLPTRIWHWVNALAVFVMLMSGLMIFNAHPRLYWGQYGANADDAWLEIGSIGDRGVLAIGGMRLDTTGVLGRWMDGDGNVQRLAFPGWATIPTRYSLSAARRWHLAFAWLLVASAMTYWVWSFANRHIQRDLIPRAGELKPRHIWQDIKDHARLKFDRRDMATRYNILQKLSYLAVLFGLLPLMVLSGLAMSPGMDAAWPWLTDIFAGRQSARSIHFICAVLLAAFILIHLLMVLLSGPLNGIRAMITGRHRLPTERNG